MSGLFKVPVRRQQVLLFVVDLALLLLSLMLAFVIARFARFNILFVLDKFTVACFIYFTVYALVFYIGQLYEIESRFEEIRSFLYICGLVIVANLFISMFYYFLPNWRIARRVMAIQAPIAAMLIYLWRKAFILVSRGLVSPRNVLILGRVGEGASLIEELKAGSGPEYALAGVLDDTASGDDLGVPVLGGPAALQEMVAKRGIDIVVFAPGNPGSDGELVRSVLEMKARGLRVYELATFYKTVTGKVPVRYIEDRWLLFSQDFTGIAHGDARNLKRLIDVIIAGGSLILLSPLMVLIAIMVKLTSRGPVLYRQERVGLDKQAYSLMKFRTMRVDAEKEGTPVWASENDKRVTPIGGILRSLRLDELPQFVNVLKGEMSVIGPRPERPFFVEQLEKDIPYYSLRFSAKPGLTGWAQVNYPYGASVEDAHTKLQYDLYYIQETSLFLDLVILLKTLQTVLFRPGY